MSVTGLFSFSFLLELQTQKNEEPGGQWLKDVRPPLQISWAPALHQPPCQPVGHSDQVPILMELIFQGGGAGNLAARTWRNDRLPGLQKAH